MRTQRRRSRSKSRPPTKPKGKSTKRRNPLVVTDHSSRPRGAPRAMASRRRRMQRARLDSRTARRRTNTTKQITRAERKGIPAMARKLGFAAGMIAIAAFAAFFAAGASAQSATTAVRTAAPAVQSATPASIEDQLTTQFKLVKLGSHGQVVLDAGTVLTIQKAGLVGFSPWLPKVCPSTYKDGKMNSPNALCLMAARDVTRDLT